MQVHLRPANASDAERVAEILLGVRIAFMPYAPMAHSDADVREWVAGHLIPTGGVTVAELDGRVLGMSAIERAEVSWITQLAVDPAFVGRGIGSLLLAEAMRVLPAPIRLYAFQANSGARRLYERHGFRALEFTDGETNEERCPDVLYEISPHA